MSVKDKFCAASSQAEDAADQRQQLLEAEGLEQVMDLAGIIVQQRLLGQAQHEDERRDGMLRLPMRMEGIALEAIGIAA